MPNIASFGRKAAGDTTIKPVRVGGGGFNINLSIADDGTVITGVDIHGLFKYNPATAGWEQMMEVKRMPDFTSFGGNGAYAAVVCPTQSKIMYAMLSDGNVWKTVDGGSRWYKCPGWTNRTDINSNQSGNRFNGPKMAVDPINPDIVYCGTPSNGVFVTFDGGATFSAVTGVPSTNQTDPSGGYGICFDRYAGITGGNKTSNVYICSPGSGVYKNTSGGTSFSAVGTGSPNYIGHILAFNGVVLVTDYTNIKRWNGSAWSTVYSSGAFTIALDTSSNHASVGATTARLCAFSSGGVSIISTDGGQTWGGSLTIDLSYPDASWLTTTIGETGYTSGEMKFNPNASNELWSAFGLGVSKGSPSTSAYTMTGIMKGMENLTYNRVKNPPSSTMAKKCIYGVWDQSIIKINDPDSMPTTKQPDNTFNACWDLDYSIDGTAIVSYVWRGPGTSDLCGKSTDQGDTYTTNAASFMRFPMTVASNSSGTTVTLTGAVSSLVPAGAYVIHNSSTIRDMVSKSGSTITLASALTVSTNDTIEIALNSSGNGAVACSTASNWMIQVSPYQDVPRYTTNSGASWSLCSIPDMPIAMNATANGTTTLSGLTNSYTGAAENSNRFQTGDYIVIQPGGATVTVTGKPSSTSITVSSTVASGTVALRAIGFGGWASYVGVHDICADKNTAGIFYGKFNRGLGNGKAEFYRSTDSGATWSKRSGVDNTSGATVGAGDLAATPYFAQYYSGIKPVIPGTGSYADTTGHVYWHGETVGQNLLKTTDGGATWAVVGGISSVFRIGFGKPKPGGGGYPTIFANGTVNGTSGLYRADDGEQATPTWVLLAQYPLDSLNGINDLDGDKNVYGRFYGCLGHAPFYGYINSATT